MTEIKQPKIRFKGNIDNWEQRKGSEIFKTVSDKNHPDLPVLSASQKKGMVLRNDINIDIKYDKKSLSTYKKVLYGQFVVHLRSFQGGFAFSNVEGITSPAYTILDFKNENSDSNIYWKYVLSSKKFIKMLEKITYGIRDGKSISFSDFSTLKFYAPPIVEQTNIGEFFKTLDDTIALHKQKLEVTKQFKQTMLKKMFPKKDSNIPEIRFKGFTSEWKEQELKEFLSKPKLEELNLTSPDDLMTLKLNLGGLVSSKNKTTLSLTSTKYYKRKAGQFIFGKQNFFNGSMAIIPERFNNKGTSSFVPSLNIKNINSYFLYLNMSRKDFYKEKEVLAEGTGSKVLSENTLLSFKIKITENSNEQELIGNYFKELDNKIKDLEQKLETYKEFKKAMLQKMFI